MFGLMHFSGCQKTDEELYRRRLLYCGTCKAIGSNYGQSARMLLNNDVVFLAEILQAISTESTAKIEDWAPAFQSYNCLSLPNEAEIPTTLRIAASVSMILSALKLEDHIDDSGSLIFRSAKKCLDPVFSKSESEFSRLEFPMAEIRKWFDQQGIREQHGRVSEHDSLSMFAEPTAMITAIVFEHSGSIVSGDKWKPTMHRIGYGFGSLIYLIDAFEDYARDFRTVSFNAIASAHDLKTATMPADIEKDIEHKIRKVLNELDECIKELPLALEEKQEYSERLWRNVRRKTGFKLHKHSVKSHAVKIGVTTLSENQPSCNRSENSLQSRWQTACTTASTLTSELMPSCDSKLILSIRLIYRASIYLFVLLVAFLSPIQSRSIRTYRECIELPFNLMFWGAAIATIINSFVQAGNKGFAYAHAMVGGGNGNNRPTHEEFSEPTRLSEGSPDEEKQDEHSDENDDEKRKHGKPQKGINNDRFQKSRAISSPSPVCICCDCSPCFGMSVCGEGCDCCCASGDCCASGEGCGCCCDGCSTTEGCCAGECCGGGSLECCSGGSLECCGGECCGGSVDCCAGGGDCCGGGADCCGGCFS